MHNLTNEKVICVLTARGAPLILEEGGSQSWTLNAKRARMCEYVVCVQNIVPGDWGDASAKHHDAFLIGRLADVVEAKDEGAKGKRWLLKFSEYAELPPIGDAWPGYRNPVWYTSLQEIGIDVSSLQFKPMPEPVVRSPAKATATMTIAQAKEGLAASFGVSPSDIEITIRG